MDMEELNEVATLLHISSEIATNHPKLTYIAKICAERLLEINQDLIDADSPPKLAPRPAPEVDEPEHEYVVEESPVVERRV